MQSVDPPLLPQSPQLQPPQQIPPPNLAKKARPNNQKPQSEANNFSRGPAVFLLIIHMILCVVVFGYMIFQSLDCKATNPFEKLPACFKDKYESSTIIVFPISFIFALIALISACNKNPSQIHYGTVGAALAMYGLSLIWNPIYYGFIIILMILVVIEMVVLGVLHEKLTAYQTAQKLKEFSDWMTKFSSKNAEVMNPMPQPQPCSQSQAQSPVQIEAQQNNHQPLI